MTTQTPPGLAAGTIVGDVGRTGPEAAVTGVERVAGSVATGAPGA